MAFNYVGSLKSILARGEFPSESAPFRLCYQATVAFLVGSSLFLSASEFFGDPINCITDVGAANVINTYCWIKSTFTMEDYQYRDVGTQVAQPGVATGTGTAEDRWTFHNYYQWVVFFLCFQAATMYFPKLIWNSAEGGLMKAISEGLNKALYLEEEVDEKRRVVVNYVSQHIKMHNGYVFKYWLCEALCFVMIIVNMALINSFLGGEFWSYGSDVIEYSQMDQNERVDPMIYVFPRMTKCTFHKFGPSGTIKKHDAFCLLPLNILNEKIFILQWFWFIALAVVFGVLLMYRLVLIIFPGLRPRVMYQHNKAVPFDVFNAFTSKTSIGDWWIMYVLSRNIDPLIYGNIMSKLAKELGNPNDFKSSAPAYSTSAV